MNVLSLFAGVGGLDLGLEANGCETVAYSEIEPYAASIMALRFPGAVNYGDITTIDWEQVRERHDIDIICGGFPCQDISAAWAGPGIEGKRSGLWRFYAEAIRLLRPRGVLVENVANLTSRGLDVVLGDLAALGYDAEWGVLRASDVGALHERARMFVLAYPNGSGQQEQRRPGSTPAEHAPSERDGSVLAGGSSAEASVEARPRFRADPGAWEVEPDLPRVVDGIPSRVDRIRCLGNAVVPHVAARASARLLELVDVED